MFISTNAGIFRWLLPNTAHVFQSLYQTTLTLSESYCQTVLQNKTFSRVCTNNTDIFKG